MSMHKLPTIFVACAGVLALTLFVAPAWGQVNYDVDPKNSTDGTAVPDVDKAGIPPGPPIGGASGPDLGCWAATASNILGAAGWGVGANAQAKANSIYADFITNFEVNAGDGYIAAAGNCAAAAKWWIHNIGLNSAQAGQGYDPTNPYVDFGLVERTLIEPDYNYLLNELLRCQYVGVTWITGGDTAHCMTLVGGNYGPSIPGMAPPHQSIWHNSDNEGGAAPNWIDDEIYGNDWSGIPANPTWYLDVNNTPGNTLDDWFADAYFKACQGVPKPAIAVDNYDVHYYRGPDRLDLTGQVPLWVSDVQMLVTGENKDAYTGWQGSPNPEWDPTGAPILYVPNEEIPEDYKILYLLVDFKEAENPDTTNVFNIQVIDDEDAAVTLDEWWWSEDNGQILMKYVFDGQPDWEKVVFPHANYKDLTGNILEWNIATYCVPEPVSLAQLGVVTLLGLLFSGRRRRR